MSKCNTCLHKKEGDNYLCNKLHINETNGMIDYHKGCLNYKSEISKKAYYKMVISQCTCKYCGTEVLLVNNFGECSKGCSGNFVVVKETYLEIPVGTIEFPDKVYKEGRS